MTALTQLGHKTAIPMNPGDALIECIDFSPAPVCVRFQTPEFTSLCPVTRAPDFGRIVIDYVPDRYLIESKSLKLFLNSFRNEGAFHEEVAYRIGERLWLEARPLWIRVCAFFAPRGGIPIDVFFQRGEKPTLLYVPDVDAAPFRGR